MLNLGTQAARRLVPLWLVASVTIAYAPSLGGDFLNYDDGWLIAHNPVLRLPAGPAMARIWSDFTSETRHHLGAEYLPVRDASHWIEARVFGLAPPLLRVTNLAIYIVALLLLRHALRPALSGGLAIEGAVFLFALHPVHVESVAWLAGRKDVLALAFAMGALAAYAAAGKPEGSGPDRRWLVWAAPPLVGLACLSKAVSVVSPLLLLVHDAWMGRRPRWATVALAGAFAAAALALHIRVGSIVSMTTPPVGGSRLAAAATMGPVWSWYLAHMVFPAKLSIIYDVPARAVHDWLGWLGYGPLVLWTGAALLWWRKTRRPLPLVALAWFVIPLLPTTQIVAPLQNLMADRYLLMASLGPCLLAAAVLATPGRVSGRLRIGILSGVVLALAALSAQRAWTMSDSVRVWTDAASKSEHPTAAYQLGMALRERGDSTGAQSAFRAAIARAGDTNDTARAARNNLAALLAEQGRLPEAEAVLRESVALFPHDPKVLNNLAEVVARAGDHAAARLLYRKLLSRFPDYETGKRNYRKRYGDAAPTKRGLVPPAQTGLPGPQRQRAARDNP
jgi:hypothetical protein